MHGGCSCQLEKALDKFCSNFLGNWRAAFGINKRILKLLGKHFVVSILVRIVFSNFYIFFLYSQPILTCL